jgi:TfoX N-terminal domain
MAHDPELAARYRAALGESTDYSEKRMMGGTCFFLNGNMIGGADRAMDGQRRFMFRVGKANAEHAAELGADGPLLLGDRVMPGFYFVGADRCDDALFGRWLTLALEYARSLPPK